METNQFKEKIKSNLGPIIVVGLGVVLIVGGLIYSLNKNSGFRMPEQIRFDGQNCETEIQKYTVDGGTDILPEGSVVNVEMNYYNCHRAQPGEIVMIKTPGRDTPLLKYIKMVPGDKFEVVEKGRGKYKIEVNGDIMKNSSGQDYEFSEKKSRMVKLYEGNFKGGIRDGVYFVFGENTGGGFDSTRFGPVTPERMVGRVLASNETPQESKPAEVVEPIEEKQPAPTESENSAAVDETSNAKPVVAPVGAAKASKQVLKPVAAKATKTNKKK